MKRSIIATTFSVFIFILSMNTSFAQANLIQDSSEKYIEINGINYGYEELSKVEKGDLFDVYGKTAPGTTVELIMSNDSILYTTLADTSGAWQTSIDTSTFETGVQQLEIRLSSEDGKDELVELLNFEVIKKDVSLLPETGGNSVYLTKEQYSYAAFGGGGLLIMLSLIFTIKILKR